MKPALSLIEVLTSVIIITVVIGSLLKIKDQNLSILQSSNERSLNQSYISLFALNHSVANNRNKKELISSELQFNDDAFKRTTENIIIKDTLETSSIEDDTLFQFNIVQSSYELNNGYKNTFYTIRIEE